MEEQEDKKQQEEEEIQEPEGQEEGIFVKDLEELQGYKEKYLRLLAESENTRKRMQKEKQELTKYAVENAITEFLNPLDHFEKALKFAESTSEEVKNWAIGFEMILGQFKQVLSNHGIEEYHCIGKIFDPHLHEAVEMQETDEHPPGTILEEFVKGYMMGERPLRVARVKVAKEVNQSDEKSKK